MKLIPKILPIDEFNLLHEAQLLTKIIDYDQLKKPKKNNKPYSK